MILLAFTNFPIFPKKTHYKSGHLILDNKNLESNFEQVQLHLFGFDQVQWPSGWGDRTDHLEEKFYPFFRHLPTITPEVLHQLVGVDNIIQRIFAEVDCFYWTEEEVRAYAQEEKNEKDHIAIMDAAIAKGRKEERTTLFTKLIA